jgi:hypothetical protein
MMKKLTPSLAAWVLFGAVSILGPRVLFANSESPAPASASFCGQSITVADVLYYAQNVTGTLGPGCIGDAGFSTAQGGPNIHPGTIGSNTNIGTQQPPFTCLTKVYFRESSNTQAVTVTVGTTSGGNDVITATVVPQNNYAPPVDGSSSSMASACTKVARTLYLNSALWGTGTVNSQYYYQSAP